MNPINPEVQAIKDMRRLLRNIDCAQFSHDEVALLDDVIALLDYIAHGHCAGSLCRSCVNSAHAFARCIPPLVVMGGNNPCTEVP